MEATRPACIPPPVGFHVMKNLCSMAGEVHSVKHTCTTHTHTHTHTHINTAWTHIDGRTCSFSFSNCCTQPQRHRIIATKHTHTHACTLEDTLGLFQRKGDYTPWNSRVIPEIILMKLSSLQMSIDKNTVCVIIESTEKIRITMKLFS